MYYSIFTCLITDVLTRVHHEGVKETHKEMAFRGCFLNTVLSIVLITPMNGQKLLTVLLLKKSKQHL